jgi:hypothetical protein
VGERVPNIFRSPVQIAVDETCYKAVRRVIYKRSPGVKDQEARDLFRSVVGQLITPVEKPSLSAPSLLCDNTPLEASAVMLLLLDYSIALAHC